MEARHYHYNRSNSSMGDHLSLHNEAQRQAAVRSHITLLDCGTIEPNKVRLHSISAQNSTSLSLNRTTLTSCSCTFSQSI